MNATTAAQIANADTDLLVEIASLADSMGQMLSRNEAIQAIREALEVPLSSARLDAANVRNALRNYGFSL